MDISTKKVQYIFTGLPPAREKLQAIIVENINMKWLISTPKKYKFNQLSEFNEIINW